VHIFQTVCFHGLVTRVTRSKKILTKILDLHIIHFYFSSYSLILRFTDSWWRRISWYFAKCYVYTKLCYVNRVRSIGESGWKNEDAFLSSVEHIKEAGTRCWRQLCFDKSPFLPHVKISTKFTSTYVYKARTNCKPYTLLAATQILEAHHITYHEHAKGDRGRGTLVL